MLHGSPWVHKYPGGYFQCHQMITQQRTKGPQRLLGIKFFSQSMLA